MKKIYYFIILILVSNCSINKVIDKHGVNFLEKKQEKLILNKSNKNDIVKILGAPSTEGNFDNNLLIYIERINTKKSILKLGKKTTILNNILVLEINERKILVKKDFYNIKDMKKIKISKNKTESTYSKSSFVYSFLSSVRRKINDPLGKRK